VQGKWAKHFGCNDGRCAGEDLTEDLVEAWTEVGQDKAWADAGLGDVLHIMQDRDLEGKRPASPIFRVIGGNGYAAVAA
jgi:glutathionylspermidine amidase/synthetase